MQSIQNLKENIFSECQNYLQEIRKIETQEELFQQEKTIGKLLEQTQFLSKLSEIDIEIPQFSDESKAQIENLEATNENLKTEYWEILQQKEEEISELSAKIKVLENVEVQEKLTETVLPKMPLENAFADLSETEEIKENEFVENIELENLNVEEIKSFDAESTSETEINETVEEQIKLIQEKEAEERRRKIVEFNKTESVSAEPLSIFDEFKNETLSEKKFRLGKIKGLGIVKSLFDDDFLEEKPVEKIEEKSLHNSNMATDFMEAEKFKQDFRIDLNDKLAFTKLLFKGDENELKSTVNQLNSYKTLDEAKEYLSELYYQNDWKKADEYAQRLWVLVENKFI
ncbi:hypothetical protein [Halpernia frigidisoli]|uniref:Uncharacterized protein n=1 Tax=Halpernia frigidisoli TaxID=1125876 RepID=A0A1I3H056_9FLAO|nr:hypothetical protein [Halpernia frigidisoli]SFI29069.1 hypothetical protein SAMN05443292_2119 [Halpernia frigidisoli]